MSDRTLLTIVGERDSRPDSTSRLIELSRVQPDPNQPRKSFRDESIDELAQSIASLGMLQPVVVRRSGDDFILISGERRYRAATRLGLKEIPAIVRDLPEEEIVVASLVENLQREDIPPDEEAAAFDELLRSRGLGVRELARLIHKDPGYVSRRVRVYEDAELGGAVRSGKIAVSTAERILSARPAELRAVLVSHALNGSLDQRTVRAVIRNHRATKKASAILAAEIERGGQSEAIELRLSTIIGPSPVAHPQMVADVVQSIEMLISAHGRPTLEDHRRLREVSDRFLDWVIRLGPLPW